MENIDGYPFVHLHLHSSASLLDGVGSIKRYVEQCKEFNMPAMAVTDHGNMSNLFELYKQCKKNDIKPIMGCEMYVKPNKPLISLTQQENEEENSKENADNNEDDDKKTKVDEAKQERKSYHQIVLAKNEIGWKNLCKLNFFSFQKPKDEFYDEKLGGFYYRPRITREALFANKEGIIATSACMASEINRHISAGLIEEAYKLVEEYKQIFGDDYYIELQLNELEEEGANQKLINKHLIDFARALDIKTIITSDTHYNNREDAILQDIVIGIARRTTIYDEKAFKLHARNLYFHNRGDHYRLNEEFKYGYSQDFIDECLDNTLEIADKCNFEFEKKTHYPSFYENSDDSKKKLTQLCIDALKEYAIKKNFDNDTIRKYKERLKHELSIIQGNGYSDYMLIVWDMMRYAREKGIATGPGRGSVGCSLVAYLLKICKLDPVKRNLFFERFLNENNLSTPDIDLDFSPKRRHEVIDYLKDKYGRDKVIRVGNYNTFNIKGCLRDLVRVTDRSKEDVDFICSPHGAAIPDDEENKITAKNVDDFFLSFKDKPDAKSRRVYQWYSDNADLIGWYKKLDGEIRHLGQHAGGVLIAPDPVYCFIPVNRTGDTIVTGFPESSEHKHLSELGLLKLDVLGLTAVDMIEDTINLIQETKGINIREVFEDLDEFVDNSPELYKDFAKGDNFLIFQFEGNDISYDVKQAIPKTFSEVAAINSLHRPGALKSGATARFAEINSGRSERKYFHPIVDEILDHTHGVIAFQEDVTRLIHACTDLPVGVSELIRKEIMDKQKKFLKELELFDTQFVELAVKKGIPEDVASEVKHFIKANADYVFNQCLSSDTEILTTNGNKKITDFIKGDNVFSFNSKTKQVYQTKVKALHANGRKLLYKIKTIDGKEIKCTLDHKFMIETGEMKTLKEIIDNDFSIIEI